MNELTKLQKYVCNLIAAIMVILCGIILLFSGTGIIPLKILDILLPSLLFTVGFILLMTAIIQSNSLSMWLAFCFIIPALVIILVVYTKGEYSNLYPMYIAIPAISSLATLPLSEEKSVHLKSIIFFGILSVLFSLKSGGFVSWNVAAPLLIIFAGLVILYFALKPFIKKRAE